MAESLNPMLPTINSGSPYNNPTTVSKATRGPQYLGAIIGKYSLIFLTKKSVKNSNIEKVILWKHVFIYNWK